MKYFLAFAFVSTFNPSQGQLIRNKVYYSLFQHHLCGDFLIFYNKIGFYEGGCEANSSELGAFRYDTKEDSVFIYPIAFDDYSLIRQIRKENLDSVPGIRLEIFDLNNSRLDPSLVSIMIFKKRKKRDKLITTVSNLSASQVQQFKKKKGYYWTPANFYPLFKNEFTLEFSFDKPYNVYRVYADAPDFCLFHADIKRWVLVTGLYKTYGPGFLGNFSSDNGMFIIF